MKSMKKTIGVIIPYVDQYYQRELWESILAEAETVGYHVFLFCGSSLDSPLKNEKESNVIYNLINIEKLSGILCIAGTLSNYSGIDLFNTFMLKYQSIPVVNISLDVESQNCINVNNYASMRLLIAHVLEEHSFNKFAFISGPKTNSESNERLLAFNDMMTEKNIAQKNYKIVEGDFSKESSHKAVYYLIDELNFVPDIIICANDEMAIGVRNALEEKGIDMPGQIAFTGFDDTDNAVAFSPTFTTVDQPLSEIGKLAVRSIHQLINHEKTIIQEWVPGSLKIRESCGCNQSLESNDNVHFHANDLMDENEINKVLSDVLKQLKKKVLLNYKIQHGFGYQVELEQELINLLSVLTNELEKKAKKGDFVKQLAKLEYHKTNLTTKEPNLIEFINMLRLELDKMGMLHLSSELNNIFYNALSTLSDHTLRRERIQNYEFMAMFYYSSELITELTQVSNVEELFKVVVPYLGAFKFNEFYVCMFDQPIRCGEYDSFEYPKHVIMKLGYVNGKVLEECRFETKEMLQTSLIQSKKQNRLVFYPIFFRNTHFGYIVCDVYITTKSIFKTIREQITNTLERLRIQKKLEEIAIKDTLTNVLNRRGIYEYLEMLSLELKDENDTIGIIYGDIDKLKSINDEYGHQAGDEAIIIVASILEEALDGKGKLGRFGGDEFVCIFKEHKDSMSINQFLLSVNQRLNIYNQAKKQSYILSVSIGHAEWNPKGELTFEQALHESDSELYLHKREKQ